MKHAVYYAFAAELAFLIRKYQVLSEEHMFTIDRKENGDAALRYKHNGCDVTITVGDFWMYPAEICYFVSVSHPNGNFMNMTGTNQAVRAIFDLGKAVHFANVSGDPVQPE